MDMLELPPKLNLETQTFVRVKDPQFAHLLRDINNKYLYWDKVKYKTQKDVSAVDLWSVVKLSRQFSYTKQSFGKYVFNYFTTECFQELLHNFDMNIGGSMATTGFISERDRNRYLISSLMEEAISSSIIEGANTTRKKAKEMLRKEISPRTRSEYMIVNNYNTMNYIAQNCNENLSPENLLYIHKLITNNTLGNKDEEGYFRNNNEIYVVNTSSSEAVHTPPDFTEIPGLIIDLCDFFNADKQFIHPIIKGIIIHFMIGWIHPFTDGNGRTARSLFYWYLLKKGYWLTEYLSISKIIHASKAQYEKSYLHTEYDENDLNYFILFNLNAMQKAFDALNDYIRLKKQESIQTAQFVKIQGVNERQAYLLKKLYDEPDIVFTVKEVENRFSVSSFTARMDLQGLVKLGFVSEIQVNKVKKNYIRTIDFEKLVKQCTNL